MRAAGQLAARTLDMITEHVRPGVTTGELDRLCHDFIVANHAVPAPLNYRGFPKSICTSINHVVCHGIPGERRLLDGDVLNIDVTVILDGWHGDCSRMYVAGTPSVRAKRLLDVTWDALLRGVDAVRPGATLGDVGHAIQVFVEAARFSVGARLLRPRDRPLVPRGAERPAFRNARRRRRVAPRHVLHDRADGQRRPARGEDPRRRLDSGNTRPRPIGAVRAHGRRDRHGLRGVHPLPCGLHAAAI